VDNDQPFLLDVTRLIWRRWAGRLPTGIDRVALAYLQHYGACSQAVIQRQGFRRILPASASARLFETLLRPDAAVRRRLTRHISAETLRAHKRYSANGRIYFNVGHTALHEQSYLDWTRATGVRPVYMVHDLIPITHPEYCRAGESVRHARRIENMLASAVGIVGNSRDTLDILTSFAATRDRPVPSMLAAPLGTEIHARPARTATAAPDRATFVMLGTIEGRKNHLLLLQLWTRLVTRLGRDAPRLLIIGQRGWECEQVVDMLERSDILRDSVIEVGRCSDDELVAYLRGARALLFPTLVEGYGLPLIEALASGTPVIASDIPVFHEIGQGVPDFIDPLDGPAWLRAILDYAEPGSTARAAQMKRLHTYRAPSWDDHFASVNAWVETL
jgi:glycosyltransferase involved in cell wall biosynthesis